MVLALRSNRVEKTVFLTPAEKISKYVYLILWSCDASSFYRISKVISDAITQNTASLKNNNSKAIALPKTKQSKVKQNPQNDILRRLLESKDSHFSARHRGADGR